MSFVANRAFNFAQVIFMGVLFFLIGVESLNLGARTVAAQAFGVAHHVAGLRRAVVADRAGQFFGSMPIGKRNGICRLRKHKRKGKRAKKSGADMLMVFSL